MTFNKDLMFSSASDEWSTPQDFYDSLNRHFKFGLDPCATHGNHKCEKYFTKEQNGLIQDWSGSGNVFMNPPYGKAQKVCREKCTKKTCVERGFHTTEYVPGIYDWITKAESESHKGIHVVCLGPARTDAEWFQFCFQNASYICFLEGRLKFGGNKDAAPFPSAVIIFGKQDLPQHTIDFFNSIGHIVSL